MADKGIRAEVSLRDVEPVKSFIAKIVSIKDDPATPMEVRTRLREACSCLAGGFGNADEPARIEKARVRGWRFHAEEIEHPQRENWPSVCIVIPVFNSPELLKRCLVSLMRTDYPGQVCYMAVDNASTDPETLCILVKQPFTPLRFDEPQGFATAVNTGIKSCPGFDYYVLFNQDCRVIDEQWLTHLINWMELRPRCAVAGAKLLYDNGSVQHAGIRLGANGDAHHIGYMLDCDAPEVQFYEKVSAVTGAVLAIRSAFIEEAGLLDEGYLFGCEDIEYGLRASIYGWETWYVPDAVVCHSDHAVSKDNKPSDGRIRAWQEESHRKFCREWIPFLQMAVGGKIAIAMPGWYNSDEGCYSFCMEVGLAYYLTNCGIETTVYVNDNDPGAPPLHSRLFDVRPLSDLDKADILVAVGAEFVEQTARVEARRRFLWLPQIEDLQPDNDPAFRQTEYSIIVATEKNAEALSKMGRTAVVIPEIGRHYLNALIGGNL
ncbi:glycosyltransferase family 2 protein [bacterium]|nr:glycosyltransferase family 2 protein [bacterium]